MLNPSEKETIDKGIIVLWIIWSAMLISLCIYIFICHLLENQISQNLNTSLPLDPIKYILFIVAFAELVISYFLRRYLLTSGIAGLSSPINSPHSSAQSSYLGRYSVAMIIALAISESIGIYGLVLFFLGASFQTLYTFIGISGIAIVFYRPKKDEIITLANQFHQKVTHTTNP